MQKYLSSVCYKSDAAITYWFSGGKTRLEFELIDDSRQHRVTIIDFTNCEVKVLAKFVINSCLVDTIQYAEKSQLFRFLSSPTVIEVYNLSGNKIDEIHVQECIGNVLERRQGDCFYDSFAQGLNSLIGTHQYTCADMRQRCSSIVEKYVQGSGEHNWLKRMIKDLTPLKI